MSDYDYPEEVGVFEKEHAGPRGYAWTEFDYDDVLDDPEQVRTVMVWRCSPNFGYSVRVREGSKSLDPWRRRSPEPHSSHGDDRQAAIDEAVRLMRDLSEE
jgi:hypothetical protein